MDPNPFPAINTVLITIVLVAVAHLLITVYRFLVQARTVLEQAKQYHALARQKEEEATIKTARVERTEARASVERSLAGTASGIQEAAATAATILNDAAKNVAIIVRVASEEVGSTLEQARELKRYLEIVSRRRGEIEEIAGDPLKESHQDTETIRLETPKVATELSLPQ